MKRSNKFSIRKSMSRQQRKLVAVSSIAAQLAASAMAAFSVKDKV